MRRYTDEDNYKAITSSNEWLSIRRKRYTEEYEEILLHRMICHNKYIYRVHQTCRQWATTTTCTESVSIASNRFRGTTRIQGCFYHKVPVDACSMSSFMHARKVYSNYQHWPLDMYYYYYSNGQCHIQIVVNTVILVIHIILHWLCDCDISIHL